jgi:hypothetical protein
MPGRSAAGHDPPPFAADDPQTDRPRLMGVTCLSFLLAATDLHVCMRRISLYLHARGTATEPASGTVQ